MVQGRKMTNNGPSEILDFNTSFERCLSKLSENQKIFEFGSIVMAVERCSTTPPGPRLDMITHSWFPCCSRNCLNSSSFLLISATQRPIIASIIGAWRENTCILFATFTASPPSLFNTESNSSHRDEYKSSPSSLAMASSQESRSYGR